MQKSIKLSLSALPKSLCILYKVGIPLSRDALNSSAQISNTQKAVPIDCYASGYLHYHIGDISSSIFLFLQDKKVNGGISKDNTVEIIINTSYTEGTKKKKVKIQASYVSLSCIDFWQLVLFSLTQSSFSLDLQRIYIHENKYHAVVAQWYENQCKARAEVPDCTTRVRLLELSSELICISREP